VAREAQQRVVLVQVKEGPPGLDAVHWADRGQPQRAAPKLPLWG
jgi:hypothetical protein